MDKYINLLARQRGAVEQVQIPLAQNGPKDTIMFASQTTANAVKHKS